MRRATGLLPYLRCMTRFVIDAPTLVHLVDGGLLVDPGHQLVAPNSIRSDAVAILLGQVLRGERDEEAARRLHDPITGLRMRLLGDRVSRGLAWQIALDHGWDSLRCAEYLAVTRLQADALVTVDPELLAAAAGMVPTAPVEFLLVQD